MKVKDYVMTTAEILKEATELFKQADQERLDALNECRKESERWKAEGDWYGWNFHQGKAGGMNEASIIFYRLKRFLDKQKMILEAQEQHPETPNRTPIQPHSR